MTHVDLKAVLLVYGDHESLDLFKIYANDFATRAANEVEMRAIHTREFVAALSITGVNGGNDVEILQKVQRPVNRRDVHGGAETLDPLVPHAWRPVVLPGDDRGPWSKVEHMLTRPTRSERI